MSNKITKILIVLTGVFVAFSYSFMKVDDVDYWWHLALGKLIFENGYIPKFEMFSYTVNGTPWVDGYILSQIVMYVLYKIFDHNGAIYFLTFTVVSGYLLSVLYGQKRNIFVAALLIIPAIFVARIQLLHRPAVLAPVLVLIAIICLEYIHSAKPRRAYLVLPLLVLFVNSHPSFPIVHLIIAFFIIDGIVSSIKRENGKFRISKPDHKLKTLCIIFILSIGCVFINPYTYKIIYSLSYLSSEKSLVGMVYEWRPLLAKPRQPLGIVPSYFAILAIGIAAIIYNIKKLRVRYLLLFVFISVVAFMQRRNLYLYGMLSIPVISMIGRDDFNIESSSAAKQKIALALSTIIFITGIAVSWFAVSNKIFYTATAKRSFGLGIQETQFPVKEVELLKNNPVKGNIFHTYGIGGYFIFNLFPTYKVLLDERFYPYIPLLKEMYENDFFTFFDILTKKYNITGVMIPTNPKEYQGLIYQFAISDQWAAVAADDWGVLFLKRASGNDPIIAKYQFDLSQTPPPLAPKRSSKFLGLITTAQYPHGPLRWSQYYADQGNYKLAIQCLEVGMKYDPVSDDVLNAYKQYSEKARSQ